MKGETQGDSVTTGNVKRPSLDVTADQILLAELSDVS
jgi:hypothetical protein